jgi:outer membrane protein W
LQLIKIIIMDWVKSFWRFLVKNLALLSAMALLALPAALSATATLAAKQQNKDTNKKGSNKGQKEEVPCSPTHWSFEIRGDAYISLKEQIRKIYGSGIPTMEIEAAYTFFHDKWSTCDRFSLWANAGWSSKGGQTEGFGYYTKLNLVPISVGVEYQVQIVKDFDFYVGIGPSYSFLRIRNNDGFQNTHLKRNQFGFRTKTGFRYTFYTNFFIDAFGDYSYTHFRQMRDPIQSIDGNFSGFYVGGGLGFKW